MNACTHAHTRHTRMHARAHTRMHARTHTHARTRTHTHTHTHARTHTHTHACTHAHTHTHACTHAHTHTRMHAHTHTHTPLSIWMPLPGMQQLQYGVYLRVAAVLESNLNSNPTGADSGKVMVVGDWVREVVLNQVIGRGGMRRTRLEERDGPVTNEQHNTAG